MEDKKIDKSLNIKTLGLRDWEEGKDFYNRYEGTPYLALDSLLEEYPIKKSDKLIDFGSGRGRVAFYIYHKFRPTIIGVEAHPLTYQEVMGNKKNYMKKFRLKDISLDFYLTEAEEYQIEDDSNIFYFFNPFSIKIFGRIIERILQSFHRENRTIDLILYHPFQEYRSYMDGKTPFQIYKRIRVRGSKNKLEEFFIYRLEKNWESK